MDEAEISRAARHMIRLYGPGAVAAAEERAGRMRHQNDGDGFHTWTRIRDTIADLARKKPDEV